MTEPQHIDPERLAALLDGRLGPAEAAAVRQQLAAADDDTLAAYADAVAVSAELSDAPPDRVGDAIPIESARRKRKRLTFTVAAMAAAAAAMFAVFLFPLRPSRGDNRLAMYASAIPGNADRFVEQGWSASRGASDGLSDRARAVRVGALLTDLELDAIRRDTTKAHAMALSALLGGIEGGGGAMRVLLQQFIDGGAVSPPPQFVREAGEEALKLVDQSFADAGAYLQAARIALRNGDSTFVSRVPPNALVRLKSDTRLDEPAKAALLRLETDMRKRPIDSPELATQLTALLQMLAQ